MNILIISQYFFPDITAAAFRVKHLYDFLLTNGASVKVLSTYPHKSENNRIAETDPNIYRVKISSKKHLLQYIEFVLKASIFCFKLCRYYTFDYFFITSPPFTVFLLALFFGKNKKCILDIRDLWPDSALGKRFISPKSLIYKLSKLYELYMYKRADIITCVSKPMGEYIKEFYPQKEIVLLYNGITRDDINLLRNRSSKTYDSLQPFEIYYFGNIGQYQGLNLLFEASRSLNEDSTEIHLIGEGELKKRFEKQYRECKNVHFYPSMKREDLLIYVYERADALFINIEMGEVFDRTIPSKLFDYLLLGKPIISGIRGEGRMILQEIGSSVEFKNPDSQSLVEAIDKLVGDFNKYSRAAQINGKRVLQRYLLEENYSRLLSLIA